jgi:WD40 repeat protein
LQILDLVFDADNSRLAVLSQDGEELALWDVHQQRKPDKIALSRVAKPIPDAPAPGAGPAPAEDRRGPAGAPDGAPASSDVGTPAPASAARQAVAPPRGQGGSRRPPDQLAPAGVNVAVIPPDGQSVLLVNGATGATVRELARRDRRMLSVFGEPTGKRLVTVDVESGATSSSFRPGPSWSGFQVVLWDLGHPDSTPIVLEQDGREPRPMGPNMPFPIVSVGPDGKTIAFAVHNSTTVRLYSADDGKALKPIESQAEVSALALGPGGRLATSSSGTIQLWDVATGDFLSSFSSAQGVARIQFDPRGRLLATTGWTHQVELWDLTSRKLVAVLPNGDPVIDLGFSSDGRILAVGGRGEGTSFWTIDEPSTRAQVVGLDPRPASLAFRDDGLLAIGDVAGETWLWCEPRSPGQPPSPPRNVTAKSGRRGDADPSSDAGAARGRERPRDRAAALAFDSRGDLVAHDARGLKIWPAGTKSACDPSRLSLPPPMNDFRFGGPPLARSGDGRTMALAHGRSVYLWDADHPDRLVPVVRTDEPSVDAANPLYIPPSPPRARGPRPEPPRGPAPGPPPFPKAEDGQRPGGSSSRAIQALQIASAGDRLYLLEQGRPARIQVWRLRTAGPERIEAEPLAASDALPTEVLSLALRPDGRLLALGEPSGEVVLVDTARLEVVDRLSPELGDADGRTGRVSSLAFSPDGRRLAAGFQHGSIHVWSSSSFDANSYAYRHRLPGRSGWVSNLAFDSTGRRLASCGVEPLVDVWDLDAFDADLQRLGLAD